MNNFAYLTSELIVGKETNKISYSVDGSMVLSDPYASIKLKDLKSGSIVTDPALMVYIENDDPLWVTLSPNSYGQVLYKIAVTHDWELVDTSGNNIAETGVQVKIFDENNKEITVESIQYYTNTIEITLTRKKNIKVTLKRVG
jgi:hypothetical protein